MAFKSVCVRQSCFVGLSRVGLVFPDYQGWLPCHIVSRQQHQGTLLGDYKPWAWAFLQAAARPAIVSMSGMMLRTANSNSFVRKYFFTAYSSTQANILRYSLSLCLHILAQLSAKFSTKLRASCFKYLPNMPNILHFPLTCSNIEQEHACHVFSSFVFVSADLLFIILETQMFCQ